MPDDPPVSTPLKGGEDILRSLGILFRYRWMIVIIVVSSAIGVVVFSLISLRLPPERSPLPNKYRPEAIILVQEQQQGGISSILAASSLGQPASMAGVASTSSYSDLAVELLNSRSLLDIIASEFDIPQRYGIKKSTVALSRKAVLRNSRFVLDKKTNTISISYEDIDPRFAADITNRMVELLDQRFAAIGSNKNKTMKDMLEKQLAGVSTEMARMENGITDFQRRYGVLTVEELATEQITMLAKLRSELLMKEVEIKTYSDFAAIQDPVVKRLKSERDNLADLVKEMEDGFSSYETVLLPQNRLPELALEFARLRRDLSVQEKVYEILTQQYELTKLSMEKDEPVFQVLESAEIPDLKSGPSRGTICVVTVFIAGVASLLLSFLLNWVRTVGSDPEKMRKLLGKSG